VRFPQHTHRLNTLPAELRPARAPARAWRLLFPEPAVTASLIAPVIPPERPARRGRGDSRRGRLTAPPPLADPPPRMAAPPDLSYGIGRIDVSERVADRSVMAAMGRHSGDGLTLTAEAGVVVVRRDPGGMITLPPRPYLVIPAALRRRCGLHSGDLVLLLAASLRADMLAAYPFVVVDQALRAHVPFRGLPEGQHLAPQDGRRREITPPSRCQLTAVNPAGTTRTGMRKFWPGDTLHQPAPNQPGPPRCWSYVASGSMAVPAAFKSVVRGRGTSARSATHVFRASRRVGNACCGTPRIGDTAVSARWKAEFRKPGATSRRGRGRCAGPGQSSRQSTL
jgi:hypothetical protein